MKNFQFLLLGFALTAFIAACGGHSHDAAKSGQTDADAQTEQAEQGPEYTSAYICPMHCEGSGSDKPGECPVCGMDYEANEEYQGDTDGSEAEDHSHDHDHEGNSH